VTRPGPATAPTAAELDRFLAQEPVRHRAQSPLPQWRFCGGRPGAGRSG
jgi:hypothetical protein